MVGLLAVYLQAMYLFVVVANSPDNGLKDTTKTKGTTTAYYHKDVYNLKVINNGYFYAVLCQTNIGLLIVVVVVGDARKGFFSSVVYRWYPLLSGYTVVLCEYAQ